MALDYRRCAEEIVANIGGRDNVAQAAHCATRLRLVIKDNGKIKSSELENVDGVKGMFENNGQLQLIIGTGTVNKVYDEFLAVTGMTAATKDDVIVFVEVKTRRQGSVTSPIDAVDARKQHRICLAADSFLKAFRVDLPCRFDVVCIIYNDKASRVEHVEDAFRPRLRTY